MRRVTPQYPSKQPTTMDFMTGTRRTGPKHYTGEEVKGIVLLPKQNYTPVTHTEAEDPGLTATDPKRR